VILLATGIVQLATAKERFWETRPLVPQPCSVMNHLALRAVEEAAAKLAAAPERSKLAAKADSRSPIRLIY